MEDTGYLKQVHCGKMQNVANSRREVLEHFVNVIVTDAKFIGNADSNYVIPLIEVIEEDGITGKFVNYHAVRCAFKSFSVLSVAWDRLARDLRAVIQSNDTGAKPFAIVLRFLSGHALERAYKSLASYYDTFRIKLKYLIENPYYFAPNVSAPNEPLTLYKPKRPSRSRAITKRQNLDSGFINDAFEDPVEETIENTYVFLKKPAFIRIGRTKELESHYYVNNKMLALKGNVIRVIEKVHGYPLTALENLRSNMAALTYITPPCHHDAKNLELVVEKCDQLINSYYAVYNAAKSRIPPLEPVKGEKEVRHFMGGVS